MIAAGTRVRVKAPDSYVQRVRKNINLGRIGRVAHAFKTSDGREWVRVEFAPCEGRAHRFVHDFSVTSVEVVDQ